MKDKKWNKHYQFDEKIKKKNEWAGKLGIIINIRWATTSGKLGKGFLSASYDC